MFTDIYNNKIAKYKFIIVLIIMNRFNIYYKFTKVIIIFLLNFYASIGLLILLGEPFRYQTKPHWIEPLTR